MTARNTATSYGTVARSLHWLTALLILTNFPLGVIADNLPFDTSEAAALKAQLFSVHKTLGVAIFFVALVRILWALIGDKPVPLHPTRRLETFVAEVVHWSLYLSLVVVPLSGWIHHAAVEGFAPILWPFGQGLPFLPTSETVASVAGTAHWLFTQVLLASIVLHILGALKHAIIDADLTMARMTSGSIAGKPMGEPQPILPAIVALALFAAGGAAAWAMASRSPEAPGATTAEAPQTTEAAGNWQVAEGTLSLGVQQMGASVAGSLPVWTAAITFDEITGTGTVQVDIDATQVTLGSVSDQAKGPEFFDTATHPTARFTADITPAGDAFEAKGILSLRGAEVPVTLPFTLQINGDTATMAGSLTLDRRDFGMGPSYTDEKTVGFAVIVDVALTANRN
jgi:cytochrome b561/polyisoprenoid-binding protein YceI